MKVAVSIPDGVFKEAERLARHLKTSRSQLYSRALAELIARQATDEVTAAMDRALASIEPDGGAFQRAAARQVFQRAEW